MSYDTIGKIAILKLEGTLSQRKKLASGILKERKNIKTVVEKSEKVQGRLRVPKFRHLAGDKTLETIHIESGCRFKLNIGSCYFSPRLSFQRLEIAKQCKKSDKVLVLFAGVAPYSIIIAKKAGSRVTSVELGRECSKYARENVRLNKLSNVEVIQKDVKKLKLSEKFDRIVMPRPQLKESFLRYIWPMTKKGTLVYFYDFSKQDKLGKLLERIYKESTHSRIKIKILKIKKASEIAPYKYMYRVEFRVL
ncbi:MAG: methyltransferase domain-containing protein [archaeon]